MKIQKMKDFQPVDIKLTVETLKERAIIFALYNCIEWRKRPNGIDDVIKSANYDILDYQSDLKVTEREVSDFLDKFFTSLETCISV